MLNLHAYCCVLETCDIDFRSKPWLLSPMTRNTASYPAMYSYVGDIAESIFNTHASPRKIGEMLF